MAKAKEVKSNKPVRTMEDFQARFGKTRVDIAERSRNFGVWSTGSLRLDALLGGGLPKGRMAAIYGPPGSGKSTLALKAASLVLAEGRPVAYFDLERGLDLRNAEIADDGFVVPEDRDETPQERRAREQARASWLRTNGINPLDENFMIYEPITGEELFQMLGAGVANNLFGMMIVDSVPAIMPGRVMEGDPGDASYGSRAKLLAEELPRLLRLYGDNLETTIVFINQVRENIGAQVKSQKATGGWALDHYLRCKIKTQRVSKTEQGDDVVTESRVKVEKNVYGANGETRIRISGRRGIDLLSELLDVGRELRYVVMAGNWHYFFAEPVTDDSFTKAQKKKAIQSLPGYLASANGEGAALAWMTANGWEAKLLPIAKKLLA